MTIGEHVRELFDYGPAWLGVLAVLVLALLLRFAAVSRRDRRDERDRARRRREYGRLCAETDLFRTAEGRAPRVTAAVPARQPEEVSCA